jgi:RNA recognition motif. (a.k.a. RRM, RBD, or RNP domain)
MQTLKATLPPTTQSNAETSNDARQAYNNPLMVLPSGQTVPLASFYSQQNGTADSTSQLPYVPTGMYPNFISNAGLGTAALPNYTWPYGLAPNNVGMEQSRRASWSSNEENIQISQSINNNVSQDYYAGIPFMPMTASTSQHYIAGPIQPMKCSDNKSYEMVNLDELVSREPAIPRAVPALWTNQEELSLAKCLQNPEGITNVYIRGFMPDTTDEDLENWASRFGEIESCKAIIEQDTGKCKG